MREKITNISEHIEDMAARAKEARRQAYYLPDPDLIEETVCLSTPKLLIKLCTVIILLFLIWSYNTNIEEVAKTHGKIVPVVKIWDVQHFEGGNISEIFVKAGDFVEAGDVLVSLVPVSLSSELDSLKGRYQMLQQKVKNLQKFIRSDAASISSERANTLPRYVLFDKILLSSIQEESRRDKYRVLLAQIKQRELEIKQNEDQILMAKKSLMILKEQEKMYESLLGSDNISKREYLRLKHEVSQAEANISDLKNNKSIIQQALNETEYRMDDLLSGLVKSATEQVTETSLKLVQLKSAIEKQQDRIERLTIRAPADGTIHKVEVTSSSVILPGDVIMQIVPKGQRLVAEVKINPKDIGHIQVGTPVRIKVNTFDFTRYGVVEGSIANLSPSTFVDKDKSTYYQGTIVLSKQYVGRFSTRNHLLPGMLVEADIRTGNKSLLTYLLKPIRILSTSAFKER